MSYLIYYLISVIPALGLLWIAWIALANIVGFNEETGRLKRDGLNGFQKLSVVVFLFIDIVVNIFYVSLVMLQLPTFTRLTLTARLRYILRSGKFKPESWRYRIAKNLCMRRISARDYNHCGMGFGKRK